MIDLTTYAAPVAARLIAAEQTVAVSESSSGGLISSSLLAIPGASAYFLGGGGVYTLAARGALLPDPGSALDGVRSASEPYALWLAQAMRAHLGSTWGLAETGVSGPTGSRYGDAPGYACIAVSGPSEKVITIETGKSDRQVNMWAFTEAALSLLVTVMEDGA
jgi:PncC family amidohydrolase